MDLVPGAIEEGGGDGEGQRLQVPIVVVDGEDEGLLPRPQSDGELRIALATVDGDQVVVETSPGVALAKGGAE